MKKALAILGSPRKGGNAAQMLDLAVDAARTSGYEVQYFNLYQTDIKFCTGCMKCKKSEICVINDDIAAIRKALVKCDLVMISASTYFANVPAPVKNMFDRLVGAVMDDNKSSIPKPRLSGSQKYLLLTTCNTPFPFDRLGRQSTGTLRNMREFFHTSGMKSAGSVIFAGTRGKKKVPVRIEKKIRMKVKNA